MPLETFETMLHQTRVYSASWLLLLLPRTLSLTHVFHLLRHREGVLIHISSNFDISAYEYSKDELLKDLNIRLFANEVFPRLLRLRHRRYHLHPIQQACNRCYYRAVNKICALIDRTHLRNTHLCLCPHPH